LYYFEFDSSALSPRMIIRSSLTATFVTGLYGYKHI